MTKKLLLFLFFVVLATTRAQAIVDPLNVPNNKYGVHILEPGEIIEAAKLVNSTGGDWGYVTIPIRSNDRDSEKWAAFFKSATNLHLIPILRITTYPDKADWTAPTANDLVDFANFLDGLPWPTKNRYVILFNEPNHSQEWGGYLSPLEYANLLTESSQIFKSRNADFFLIAAGLDMSSPQTLTSQDALYYTRQLNYLRPHWFDTVDGLAFHAYPNPAFSASALSKTRYGPKSYTFELDLLFKAGLPKSKPIFITETGTILQNDFYKTAFTSVWTEPNIVAITPFLLFAGSGDFARFSLLDQNHKPKITYNQIYELPKTPGSPLLAQAKPTQAASQQSLQDVSQSKAQNQIIDFLNTLKKLFHLLDSNQIMKIGNYNIKVEVRDTIEERAKGLSGRTSLGSDHGMLFVFDSAGIYPFWMKDMLFALDFIWIKDGRVVELTQNIPPPTRQSPIPVVIIPKQAVDQVLEITAGQIETLHLQIGDVVTFLDI